MRFKQMNPIRQSQASRYRLYSAVALTDAYKAVKEEKMSVTKAAKIHGVPEQTLRDRVIGHIAIDTVKSGVAPMFDLEEEAKIVSHLQAVAKYGYGYTREEVVEIATDYCVHLDKRAPNNPLTINWFRGFIKRWPELHVIKPRALELQRAKCTTVSVVNNYFDELEKVLTKYNLKDKPHLIFNVDEKGLSQNHVPPYVVAGIDYNVQAVTTGKTRTTTILGCGSASGQMIPPYYVFAGHRMMLDLLKDGSPGCAGTVTESGWSNSQVFHSYLEDHFLKFAPHRQESEYLLILFDGHKSHVSIDLVEWAKDRNIILFILPAHTSHILQPLDVAVYGPLQKIYDNLCHKFTRSSSGCIDRYDVCGIASKAYTKAFAPENLHSAFRRTGIYPLNRTVIPVEAVLPAEIFESDSISQSNRDTQVPEINSGTCLLHNEMTVENNTANDYNTAKQDENPIDQIDSPSQFMHSKLNELKTVKGSKQNQKKPETP